MYGGILDNTDDELSRDGERELHGNGVARAGRRASLRHRGRGRRDHRVGRRAARRRQRSRLRGTKAAQVVFAGAVDRELRERGVRVTSICPAAVKTEFALGKGRTEGDPALDVVMQPEDVAAAVVFTLEQPRRLRTTQWSLWSAAEGSSGAEDRCCFTP